MPHTLRNIFSPDEVNTGRQVNLDLAKVVALVFMTCMGIGFTYWHHREEPAAMCRRGCRPFSRFKV